MGEEILPQIRHKSDIESAKAIAALGYPAVATLVPHMLEWIQDLNWPVAKPLSNFLASIGHSILPEIRAVLAHPTDTEWKYSCIEVVLKKMDPIVVQKLRPEIEQLAFVPSSRDKSGQVDEVARELLACLDGNA